MSDTRTRTGRAPAAPAGRAILELGLAVVVAAVANVLIGLLLTALTGGGAPPGFIVFLTVVGAVLGILGWVVVRAVAPRPAPVLRVLVPLVVVLSVVPDVLLVVGGAPAVVGVVLAVMHVVVAVPVVFALRRVLPV